MAWCPQCKNEYKEGIKTCVDCGCDLVENEQYDDLVPLLFGEEDRLELLKKYLEYNKLEGVAIRYDEADEQYELLVREGDKSKAYSMINVFMQQEVLRELKESKGEETEQEKKCERPAVYSSSSQNAEENRSSAWAQLLVGSIGLLFLILCILDIIPLNIGNSYLFYGGMGCLFVFFIWMGMVCLRRAKVFDKRAESENSLKDAITAWYQQNLTAEGLDAELSEEDDLPEEMLYFKRAQIIKDKLNHQFVNLDQVFLEHMIDNEIYDYIYAEKER